MPLLHLCAAHVRCYRRTYSGARENHTELNNAPLQYNIFRAFPYMTDKHIIYMIDKHILYVYQSYMEKHKIVPCDTVCLKYTSAAYEPCVADV